MRKRRNPRLLQSKCHYHHSQRKLLQCFQRPKKWRQFSMTKRETPTSTGPNSFGKGRFGFCDRNSLFQKEMKKKMEEVCDDWSLKILERKQDSLHIKDCMSICHIYMHLTAIMMKKKHYLPFNSVNPEICKWGVKSKYC